MESKNEDMEFFNQLKLDLSVTSGNRALDKVKVKQYLATFTNKKNKKIAKKIIKQTKYITYDEFYQTMLRVIKELPSKFNLLLPVAGVCSVHWLIALFWPYLKSGCVDMIIGHEEIRNNLPVVLLDDCVYSGGCCCMFIEDFLEKEDKIANTIYVAIAYANITSVKMMLKNFRQTDIQVLYGEDIYPFKEDVPDGFSQYDINDNCPVYFDHCVAGESSSFPFIYLDGYVPELNKNLGSLLQHPVTKDYKEKLKEAYEQYVKKTDNNFLLLSFSDKN
jgi:hypothetical protein